MAAPPPARFRALGAGWTWLAQTARLMIGLPDYPRYLRHMAEHHPGATPMSRAAFIAERQRARYGRGGGGRCC